MATYTLTSGTYTLTANLTGSASLVPPEFQDPDGVNFASVDAAGAVDVSYRSVPEPASLALLGLGALGLVAGPWRRRAAGPPVR